MHPALDELIALRDGTGSPEQAAHTASCPQCQEEVARLRALAEALRALPAQPPARDIWPSSREALRRKRLQRWVRFAAAACFLIAGVAGAFWLVPGGKVPWTAPAKPEAQAAKVPPASAEKPALSKLISQSQLLEKVLEGYDSKSTVMSSRSAGAIADLQDRVALIDLQIGMAEDGSVPETRVAELWEYRVRLLASMVEIHSARGEYTRI